MYFAALMAAVMVSFSACEKNNKPNHRDDDDDDEPAFVPAITVDGNFDDWDALIAEKGDKVVTAELVPGAEFTGLEKVKVYADQLYINIYIEFYAQHARGEWDAFHVYLDADNSNATGGYGDEFSDANAEYMLEGPIFDGTATGFKSYDPALFKWWGDVGGDGWLWTDPSTDHDDSDLWGALIGTGMGSIGTGAGSGNKYEMRLLREAMAGVKFADTFGIGFDIQENWSSCGILPAVAVSDDNEHGHAPKLKVTIDK